jgi:hypothetical protein
MSLSSLAGEGGEGGFWGEGSLGGSSSVGAGGGASAFSSGALITNRDGIVGSWTTPQKEPADSNPPDDEKRMRLWDPEVRARVLDFELLSSFEWNVDDKSNPPVAKLLVRSSAAEVRSLVELERPSTDYLRKNQIAHVYSYADLRRDRAAEILSQIKGIDVFFGNLAPLHPERHRFTLELLAAFYRALVSAEMRIKHALAVPRPVEFSPQILPMIQTPGHGSFPAGHAAESFMMATVLSALMKVKQPRYADWNERLARLAARISVNRVIAGMHFPVDLAAGFVLGITVGGYFLALAEGKEEPLTPYKFEAENYGAAEFPWADFPFQTILTHPLPELNGPFKKEPAFTPKMLNKGHSPLCWLWGEAVKEWQQ